MIWKLRLKHWASFGVLLLVGFAVGLLAMTARPGSGTADEPPPPLPADAGDHDVVPVWKDGKHIGWKYSPAEPEDLPADYEPTPLPDHLAAAIARGERVVYEERPGVTVTIEKGEVSVLIDPERAEPLHQDSPIFPTREEAERYAATKRRAPAGP